MRRNLPSLRITERKKMRIGEQFPELDGDDDDNSKQIMNKKGAGEGAGGWSSGTRWPRFRATL